MDQVKTLAGMFELHSKFRVDFLCQPSLLSKESERIRIGLLRRNQGPFGVLMVAHAVL